MLIIEARKNFHTHANPIRRTASCLLSPFAVRSQALLCNPTLEYQLMIIANFFDINKMKKNRKGKQKEKQTETNKGQKGKEKEPEAQVEYDAKTGKFLVQNSQQSSDVDDNLSENSNEPTTVPSETLSSHSIKAIKRKSRSESISSEIVTNTYPVKIPKGVSSWVWHYIERRGKNDLHICKVSTFDGICGKAFQQSTSTGNLAGHLRSEHRINEHTALNPTLAAISTGAIATVHTPTIISALNNVQSYDESMQSNIDNCLMNWIIDDMQPFTTIENAKFHTFIERLNKKYKVPSIHTLKSKIFASIQYAEQQLVYIDDFGSLYN